MQTESVDSERPQIVDNRAPSPSPSSITTIAMGGGTITGSDLGIDHNIKTIGLYERNSRLTILNPITASIYSYI